MSLGAGLTLAGSSGAHNTARGGNHVNQYRSKAELIAEAHRRELSTDGTRQQLIDRLSDRPDPDDEGPDLMADDDVDEPDPDDEGPDLMADDDVDDVDEEPESVDRGESTPQHHTLNPAPPEEDAEPLPPLPMPKAWPQDLPPPDLEPPVVADPSTPPIPAEGRLEIDPSGRAVRVRYWVGRKVITRGMVDAHVMAALRDQALVRARDSGLTVRSPRLETWVHHPLAAGGVLTYVVGVRRPR
jgi:hypothetical protein